MDELIGQKPATDAMIIDSDHANFMKDVVEASRTIPVLVDFWATWCGPCKTLTPTLEKVVKAAGGRVKLVKIDIDQNRALVQQLMQMGVPLQSVPTVVAFQNGQLADMFQGAKPESEIKKFVEALLKLAGGSMPGADLLAEAKAALEAGDGESAGGMFSQVLQEDPDSAEAWAGLVRALVLLGREDDAQQALANVPAKVAEHAEIVSVRSSIALAIEGRKARELLGTFEARLAADANDHAARYELATALNVMERRDEAADALLYIIKKQRGWNEDAARMQLLKFFEAWGFDDATTMASRRKLSALLFS